MFNAETGSGWRVVKKIRESKNNKDVDVDVVEAVPCYVSLM